MQRTLRWLHVFVHSAAELLVFLSPVRRGLSLAATCLSHGWAAAAVASEKEHKSVPAQGRGPDQGGGASRALRVPAFGVLKDPVVFDVRKTRLHIFWILKENERLCLQVEAIIFVLVEMFNISK